MPSPLVPVWRYGGGRRGLRLRRLYLGLADRPVLPRQTHTPLPPEPLWARYAFLRHAPVCQWHQSRPPVLAINRGPALREGRLSPRRPTRRDGGELLPVHLLPRQAAERPIPPTQQELRIPRRPRQAVQAGHRALPVGLAEQRPAWHLRDARRCAVRRLVPSGTGRPGRAYQQTAARAGGGVEYRGRREPCCCRREARHVASVSFGPEPVGLASCSLPSVHQRQPHRLPAVLRRQVHGQADLVGPDGILDIGAGAPVLEDAVHDVVDLALEGVVFHLAAVG